MESREVLLQNIDKIHTTKMGIDRIRNNLKSNVIDVVSYRKEKILNPRN